MLFQVQMNFFFKPDTLRGRYGGYWFSTIPKEFLWLFFIGYFNYLTRNVRLYIFISAYSIEPFKNNTFEFPTFNLTCYEIKLH